MSRRTSRPFSGIVFGWEREAPAGKIGFTNGIAGQKRTKARRKLVSDESEAHVMVVAPTGSGKGRNLMIPTLLTSHAPAVVLDVKGEAAAVTARARREMGHEVYIIDPFRVVTETPDTLNPLDVIDPSSRGVHEDALEATEAIIGPEASLRDRFWDNWARSLVSAVVHFVLTAGDEPRTLANVSDWLNGDEVDMKLALLLDNKRVSGTSYNNIAGYLRLPERETRPSVLGTVQQHIRLFGSDVVREAMSATSFDLQGLRDGRPLTIYLVMPPDKLDSHAPILRMWLWALMSMVIRRKRNPRVPTLFIIDEMGHLGPMPIIERSVTLLRGYGVRLMMMLQSVGQIAKLYPNDHGTMASNCLAVAAFGIAKPVPAREVADQLGDLTAEQLLALPDDALAFRLRNRPTQVLTRLDYLKDRTFAGLFDANPHYDARDDERTRAPSAPHIDHGPTSLTCETKCEPEAQMAASDFRGVHQARAEVWRLERVLRVKRSRSTMVAAQVRRDLDAARLRLADLEAKARASIPAIFSPAQTMLPAGTPVERRHGPSKVRITLLGLGEDGLVRLRFEQHAVGRDIEVCCRPEDVNTVAYLMARGEEALITPDRRPAERPGS